MESVRNVSFVINDLMHESNSIIDSHDIELVNLCLKNNTILDNANIDNHSVNSWKQQYRSILSKIGPKWRQTTDWWKWLALSIRSDSFYLDLALLPVELKREHESQCGLDPEES